MAALAALAAAGCGRGQQAAAPPRAPPPDPVSARVQAINGAELAGAILPPTPAATTPGLFQPDPVVVKAEVLLARAHASPGVIDGVAGTNLRRAILAFEAMVGLPADGQLTETVWARLKAPASPPEFAVYTESAADVAGPFYPDVGENFVAAAKLRALGYSSPEEAIAARFHMSEALLEALNPGADFKAAGTRLAVAQPEVPALPPVDHVQVDKAQASLRAYDAQGAMVGSFPATVGSVERPSPRGVHKVVGVSLDPVYVYDPAKLTWGPKGHGKLTIRPGPNNPVGLVWIALNAPGYGIHGSPRPDKIGKTASHGCVRLTNWDALLLSSALKPGTPVVFVHQRGGAAAPGG